MISNWVSNIIQGTFDANNQSFNRQMQERIANNQLSLAEKEYYSNVDIMNKNFGLQQEAFNYNKQQAELTRMREDNAFQRRVQDYINAGFSPLASEGVASASQAPTLTAPQYDPQGVNQATQNRLHAYDKKMEMYQNRLNQQNINAELRLKNMQLSLAQIDTAKGIFESVYSTKKTGQEVRRLEYENDYYEKHGFKDTTFDTLVSDILKGINFGGKNPGEVVADAVNNVINLPKPEGIVFKKSGSKNQKNKFGLEQGYNLTDSEQDKLFELLKDCTNGKTSPFALEKFTSYSYKHLGTDFGIKYGRYKSLSNQEYQSILKQITEMLRK